MPEFDVIGAGLPGELLAGRTAAACLSTAIVKERRPRDLAGALRTAFDHEGSALVEVMVARHELSLPPRITLE
jgi:pyruvate dehydrogenase (quinone)